jgi:hypothetical protein
MSPVLAVRCELYRFEHCCRSKLGAGAPGAAPGPKRKDESTISILRSKAAVNHSCLNCGILNIFLDVCENAGHSDYMRRMWWLAAVANFPVAVCRFWPMW